MTRVQKLCAAYESFGIAIANVPDDRAKVLSRTSAGVREFVTAALQRVPKPTPSQVATGLEQGWRETPGLIQEIAQQWRSDVSRAWTDANRAHYPEFLVNEEQRLNKVIARGKIKTESEFFRVRHQIDILEGEVAQKDDLQTLYSLVDAYESR
ncbi:hypothetical protein RD110_00465 [Rhodoferax koreense]|uniref:Uncharacterized protein n=1 Tax=Rhodoferax koreensis TaxID=1842727 RepID=A0A1P8JQ48_9BURK|nr:hypothetical protein [Rhodoferax koreense]APW35874.1 hypothetical protein RD110_00465 [Rhodoferax koreense]